MTGRLRTALQTLASMRVPSVSQILRRQGYVYEAECLDEVLAAWQEYASTDPDVSTG